MPESKGHARAKKWTAREDDVLREAANVSRPSSPIAPLWNCVAVRLPGRTAEQCRIRWTQFLSPVIKRGKWTDEEDQTIINQHARLGNQWLEIGQYLNRRTGKDIEDRWNNVLKRRWEKSRRRGRGRRRLGSGVPGDDGEETAANGGKYASPASPGRERPAKRQGKGRAGRGRKRKSSASPRRKDADGLPRFARAKVDGKRGPSSPPRRESPDGLPGKGGAGSGARSGRRRRPSTPPGLGRPADRSPSPGSAEHSLRQLETRAAQIEAECHFLASGLVTMPNGPSELIKRGGALYAALRRVRESISALSSSRPQRKAGGYDGAVVTILKRKKMKNENPLASDGPLPDPSTQMVQGFRYPQPPQDEMFLAQMMPGFGYQQGQMVPAQMMQGFGYPHAQMVPAPPVMMPTMMWPPQSWPPYINFWGAANNYQMMPEEVTSPIDISKKPKEKVKFWTIDEITEKRKKSREEESPLFTAPTGGMDEEQKCGDDNEEGRSEQVERPPPLITFTVSPGRLGLTLKVLPSGGAEIRKINPSCTFRDRVLVGDRIIRVDGEEVCTMRDIKKGNYRYRTIEVLKMGQVDDEQVDPASRPSTPTHPNAAAAKDDTASTHPILSTLGAIGSDQSAKEKRETLLLELFEHEKNSNRVDADALEHYRALLCGED